MRRLLFKLVDTDDCQLPNVMSLSNDPPEEPKGKPYDIEAYSLICYHYDRLKELTMKLSESQLQMEEWQNGLEGATNELHDAMCTHYVCMGVLGSPESLGKYYRPLKAVDTKSKAEKPMRVASDWKYDTPPASFKTYHVIMIWQALLMDQMECPINEAVDENGALALLKRLRSNIGQGMKVCSLNQLRDGFKYWCGALPEWRRWTLRLRSRILPAERDGTIPRSTVIIIEEYATKHVAKEVPVAVNRERHEDLG